MKSITLKIAPGVTEDMALVGDYVRVKTASVAVRIRDTHSNVDATVEQGDALNLKPFSRLRVSHSDAAEQTIELLIGNGTSSDSARVGGSVEVSKLPASAVAMTQAAPVVGVASVQILAANTARRFLMIQNTDPAAIVYVNIAGAAASAATGVKLAPGDSMTLDVYAPSAAIFAIASAVMSAPLIVVEG